MKNQKEEHQSDTILTVKNLQTTFFVEGKEIKAVDGVSFPVKKGKTIGIVGESGSGKSITSLSIMQLIEKPGVITGGEIQFQGKDLLQQPAKQMRNIRGNRISMIFQEPMTSLNPVFTVGEQIAEVYQIHQGYSKKAGKKKAIEMLKLVGIPSPEKRIQQYPFELSGGMRQRVMIAISLACNPELLIADEPTTALDVTIQAQILELINDLQKQLGMSVIFITHDLGVVGEVCDHVTVMYAGQVVEYADVYSLFEDPKHPYTVGLMKSIPRHDEDKEELEVISGSVPRPDDMPEGCRFAARCPFATDLCVNHMPELIETKDNNQVRCWIYSDEWNGDSEVNVKRDYSNTRG